MDDETLLALMTKVDPMTARVPPGIRQIVDAVIAYERKACAKLTVDDLFDGSDPHLVDGGWVSFDVAEPQGVEVVQQYLGAAVMEHSNPPEWAFPTARWRGEKDSAATHWRYVDAPNELS